MAVLQFLSFFTVHGLPCGRDLTGLGLSIQTSVTAVTILVVYEIIIVMAEIVKSLPHANLGLVFQNIDVIERTLPLHKFLKSICLLVKINRFVDPR
jgi:hypothetical protein